MAWLTTEQLIEAGFASIGEHVLISDRASIYNVSHISIGNNVRIDDFCVLSAGSGGIEIGNFVHIAVFCSLMGSARIRLCDFSGLSSRVSVYSSSDDFSGAFLTNPTVPPEFTNVCSMPVFIGKHTIVGSGSVILPGTRLEEGTAIGALSLVKGTCGPFAIYAGVPAVRQKDRRRDLLQYESVLLSKPVK